MMRIPTGCASRRLTVAFFAVNAVLVWPATASSPILWQPIDYQLKSGATVPAELGGIEVPVDRTSGSQETLKLNFVRLKSTGNSPGNPIIYLAGGPGSSGIDAARGDRWPFFDAIRKTADIILLDQRGTGLSSAPPGCSVVWRFPSDQVADEKQINRSLETTAASCSIEWRSKGVPLHAYTTAQNADDVADLAKALGGRVRIVGISYGTFLGFGLIRKYPELVERAVFAGTEGPDHTVKLPRQADVAFADIARRAKIAGREAGLWQSLESDLRQTLAQLRSKPQTVELRNRDGTVSNLVIGEYDVQVVLAFMLATTQNASTIPDLITAMHGGNFEPIGQNVLWVRRFLSSLPAMALATDAASPVSRKRLKLVQKEIKKSLFGNAVNFPSADFALAMGIRQLPIEWTLPLSSTVPAYFISGSLDSRTPPANALEVARGFKHSSTLVVEGGGHDNDLLISTPKIASRVSAFLSGTMPPDEKLTVDLLKFK